MDGITEFAKELKKRDNKVFQSIGIGTVISAPPAIKIQFNGFVLGKDRIVVAEHLLPTYKRDTLPAITVSSASIPDHGSHTHAVDIADITFTDTLKQGDKVIVVPTVDDAIYFIIDKVGDV
jgi:hypothetical protein